MAACSAGMATFNSCNKAGSIPHFTQHLSRHPNDYTALIWRGRAYHIIGKEAEARADFVKAYRVSSGPQKNLAQARIHNIDGNEKQKIAILQGTTRQYPNCAEAWNDLGFHYDANKEPKLAMVYLDKAVQLATKNAETGEPWFPWCNQKMGDICYLKQQVPEARNYYTTAVLSANTLTIGHLGLSKCDILTGNIATAEASFLKARRLNPVLVTWKTFDEFCRHVEQEQHFIDALTSFSSLHLAARSQVTSDRAGKMSEPAIPDKVQSYLDFPHKQRSEKSVESQSEIAAARSQPTSSDARRKGSRAHCKALRIQSRGGSGNGSGGSSDEEGEDGKHLTPEKGKTWKEIKDEAPCKKKYLGKSFYQSKCQNFWYSEIPVNQRHGGACFKKYDDKGRSIELRVSLDENMKEMWAKHESGQLDSIKKNQMEGCHIHKKKNR